MILGFYVEEACVNFFNNSMVLGFYVEACVNFFNNLMDPASKAFGNFFENAGPVPCCYPFVILSGVFILMIVPLSLVIICVVFPSLPWILLYGFVIIPNEPYVKFCKDEHMRSIGMGAGHRVRAFLSNETETWECPPKPGSTWVKQSIHKDWQCNETYCTADELASPESCYQATTYMELPYTTWITVWCDNWSADNPGCCQNVYDGTYVECEYCIPDKPILWVISIFAGTATTLACAVAFDYANYKYREVMEKAAAAEEKAKKEAEEKAKKDAEAAEHSV
jgi:hypothetical protein